MANEKARAELAVQDVVEEIEIRINRLEEALHGDGLNESGKHNVRNRVDELKRLLDFITE